MMSAGGAGNELANWLTKQEAADKLQTSVRSIERRIAAGEVEAKKRRKSGPKLQYETVVNPADIGDLMPAAHVMPAEETKPAASVKRPESAPSALNSTNIYEFLQALFTTMATGATAPRQIATVEKRWLTLGEAAARSGLSERFLSRLCKTKQIRAVKDAGDWKIDRASLDTYQPANE